MTSPVIQFKRGSYANLPGLQAGEPALTTDTYELYVGIDSTTNNNKFFGSHRYWTRETNSKGSSVNLVEGTTNGSSYISLKSPDALSGVTTYTFPATPTENYYLKTSADGTLSWAEVSQNTFSGIVTFSDTTDSYDKDTGAVVIQGGLGVEKSANIGGNFSVAGVSTFVGSVTFQGGTINLGDSDADNINVAGEFVSNLIPNSTDAYDLGDGNKRWRNLNLAGVSTSSGLRVLGAAQVGSLTVDSDVNIFGNVTIGGTTVTLEASTLTVRDKDIIAGYSETPTDDTANHGGVAVASTEGYPLVSLSVAGINTLPDTYKQMMWVKGGTMGAGTTDAWIFNYAVGVGSTQVPTGTYLAVGGVAIGKTTLSVPGKVTVGGGMTVTDGDVYINDALYVGGFQVTGGVITGEDVRSRNLNVSGITTLGNAIDDLVTVAGDTTFTASITAANINSSGIITATTFSGNASSADQVKTVSASDLNATHYITFVNSHNGSATAENVYTDDGIYYNPGTNTFTTQNAFFTGNVTVEGGSVTGTASTATRANLIDTTATNNNSTYFVPFVDTLGGQTGETLRVGAGLSLNPSTGEVATKGILSVGEPGALTSYIKAGGGSNAMYMYGNGDVAFQAKVITNSIRSSGDSNNAMSLSGRDVDFGRNIQVAGIATVTGDVVVGGFSSAPTIKTATVQHSNGTQAATIDASGNIVAAQNLTVSGNLFVNGSTTQVNTESITVEDRTIELGQVNGSAPSSATTWDLGVLFNYNATGAKKSGVIWEHADSRFKFGSQVTDGGGTDNDSPQITVSNYAAIEVGSIWINDCAGQSQLVNCSGGIRKLENITIDGGTF